MMKVLMTYLMAMGFKDCNLEALIVAITITWELISMKSSDFGLRISTLLKMAEGIIARYSQDQTFRPS
jgi:hypothetical protein